MDAPEISFCIPAYNSAATIERCLRAVLAQDVPAREILVVDNASTDDTAARAHAILAGAANARVVVNDRNLGRIENWNRCVELAAGRYLKFALTNDVLVPGGVPVLLRAAKAQPDVVLVCSQPEKVETMPAVIEPMPSNPKIKVYDSRSALRHFSKTVNDTGSLNGMLVSMETVRAHNIRFRSEIPFWSDFHFAGEVAAHGAVVYVDAKSHYFDAGNKARFTFAGSNPRALCFEARACAVLFSRLLPKFGLEGWRGFEFLCDIYTGKSCYYELPLMSYRDTQALFKGAGPYFASALQYRAGRSLDTLKHKLKRAASKAGLYRYPAEK